MSTIGALVDVEALLVDHLADDSGVAALVAGRVSTKLPAGFTAQARIRLFRTGGAPDPDEPGHLDQPSIQLDCYGATQEQAFDVAKEAVRATLAAIGAHPAGVVTGARRNLGPLWSPDPATDIPRYIVGMVLWVHPTPS